MDGNTFCSHLEFQVTPPKSEKEGSTCFRIYHIIVFQNLLYWVTVSSQSTSNYVEAEEVAKAKCCLLHKSERWSQGPEARSGACGALGGLVEPEHFTQVELTSNIVIRG